MADVNANIGVNIDTSAALAQLKDLQRQISLFHSSISKSSEAAALAQRDLQRNFLNSVNAIGAFSAELRTVKTTSESFTSSLEKNKFSMREYFRYAGASTKTFGKLFKSEYDTIGKVAEDRVKKLQTQYIKMGRDASGAMKAIAIIPNELDMNNFSTQTQIAAQKQSLFNQLMKQGSTNLLNFGKNTQWAGRQLMVGFTLPLMAAGSAASKSFMQMEAQALKFKKVYGDLFTPQAETEQALADIKELAKQFTKYGIAVSDTVGLAADAAAAGFAGIDLQRQTTEATRLSVLGQIDNQQALSTTIALQNAFGISSAELADSINFLNAVENQTVVSLDDITTAIPKVAPVIQQLGGDVKDLAFFLTAMKEGGINASEGANALKSGLAALINPTTRARDMLSGLGIDINSIVNNNKGDLKATVVGFAQALDTLAPLERARAIEQMFGKFQFARLSALFANVTKDGTQASRVLKLAGASIEELSNLSEQELGKTADSSMNKFKKSVEDLKAAIVPVGEAFLKTVTPIIDVITGIAEKFSNLSDGTKKAITVMVTVIGGLGPILLMTFGLLANGVANIIKLFLTLRNGYLRLTGQSQNLGEQTQYLTSEQIDAAAAAHSLNQAHATLTQQFTVETTALGKLIAAYQAATSAAARFAGANPGMMVPPKVRKKFARGGIIRGPGGPKDDKIEIMASNGEAIIDAETVNANKEQIDSLIKTGKFESRLDLGGAPADAARSGASYRGVNRIVGGNSGLPQMTTKEIEARNARALAQIEANKARRMGMAQPSVAAPVRQIPMYAENAVRMQDPVQNMKQQAGQTDVPSVLAPLTARIAEARGITPSVANIFAGKLDPISKEFEGITQKFVNEVNKNYDDTYKDIKDSSERFQKAWSHAGKNVEQEVNSIASDVDKGVLRKTFGLDSDIYSTIPTEARKAGETNPTRARAAAFSQKKFGIRSYTGLRPSFKALYERMSGKSGSNLQVGHVYKPQMVDIDKLAQDEFASSGVKKAINTMNGGAANIAEGTIEATKKAAGTASPSKKTIPIGEDIARGLQVGMKNQESNVAKAGEKLGNSAVSGTRRSTRSQGAPRSLPMSQVSTQLLSVPKTEEQLTKFNNTINQSERKILRMNGALQGGSFALMSLSGIAQMFGGRLSSISNIVFTLSSAMFAFQTVVQLATSTQLLNIAATKANTVAQLMGAASFRGLFVGVAGILPKLRIFSQFLLKTITTMPGWGKLLAGAVLVGGALFKYYKIQQAAKERMEAFSRALITTTDQLKALGEYFGKTPTISALEKKTGFAPGTSAQISEVEKFRESEAFKQYGAPTAKAIKNLNSQQATQVLNAKMFELLGAGFSKDQIQIIIKSIQQEAQKTDLKIDFNNINLDKLPSDILKDFEKESKKIKKGAWISTVLGTKQERDKAMVPFKSEAALINKYLNGVSSAFISGQINGKQFTTMFDSLTASLGKISDKENAIKILDTAIKNMSPSLAKAAGGVKNLEVKMLLLKAASIGLGDEITASMVKAAAYTGPDLILKDIAKRSKAEIEKLVTDRTAVLTEAQKETEKLLRGPASGTGSKTLSAEAKLTIARLQKELDGLKTKRDLIDEANTGLKRQYEYQQKLMQLSQDALQAKISGNYIGAAMIGQQKAFTSSEFNKETASIALDKKITTLENRISELQADGRLKAAEIAYLNAKKNGKAMGGLIKGPGTGRSDSILAGFAMGGLPQLTVSNGEYVVQAKSVQNYGVGFMDAINNQKLGVSSNNTSSAGNTVYNIDMTINGGNQNPNDIADQVIRKLKVETSRNNKSNRVAF